jgi:hypothetical protein
MDLKFQHNGTSSHWTPVLVEDHLPFVLQTAANLRSYLLSFAVIITLSSPGAEVGLISGISSLLRCTYMLIKLNNRYLSSGWVLYPGIDNQAEDS